jgi:hypothetical protein
MSDRTQSSVRTGARGDGDDAAGSIPADAPPVTSTQSIPGASTPRSQGPGGSLTGSQPAASASGSGSGSAAPIPPIPTAAGATPVGGASGPAAPDAGKGSRLRGRGGKAGGRGPRRARLQLRHIDIWSAFKISFVLSIAMFFIWMVAVGVLYGVLSALGVFETLNSLFGQLGSASGSEVSGDVVTPKLILGGAAVIGAINIVLMTALCTVATFIYNLCSDLVGGLELTLSERD